MSGEEGRTHVGQLGLAFSENELHGTPSAEETQVESGRTGTLSAEDVQEELEESKNVPFQGKNGDSRKVQKNPLITSSSKFAKQPTSPKIPPLASSTEVQKQSASPKLLEAQLLKSKAAPIAISLAQSSQKEEKVKRTGRPKRILETRPRPCLKRHERSGQSEPQEYVPPGFLVAYSHELMCLHHVGRCCRKPEISSSGLFMETSSQQKQNTTTTANTAGRKERSRRVRKELWAMTQDHHRQTQSVPRKHAHRHKSRAV